MILEIIPIEECIKVNNLKEVTDPILFIKNTAPTPEGLVSTEIFGISVKDRKETFAYISLHSYFLHPFIYKLLKRLNRNFVSIIHGTKKFTIEKGVLIEDEENGKTGLKFLYDNWDKLSFEKNASSLRNERIDVLNTHGKNYIFTSKWIVIPAFYRDVNIRMAEKGVISHHVLNDMYSKLIRFASTLKNSNSFEFTLVMTEAKIQELLVEIYDTEKERLHKKHGMIRKNLLGKSIDYGSRLVISAPKFDANSPEELQVDFYHTGVPLAQCCTLFYPFVSNWVKNFFLKELEKTGNKYPIKGKDGKIEFVRLKNVDKYTDIEYIKKQIDNFITNYPSRFDRVELETEEPRKTPLYMSFTGQHYDKNSPETQSPIANRPLTWCDILYQAVIDVVEGKHIYVTRYPLLDYFGTFASLITVLSTKKTIPVYVGERVYPNYPVIDLNTKKEDIASLFTDTLVMSNLYLSGLGGDYDGDQVTVKGVFSQEANIEADKIMRSKSNILNIYGDNMRRTTNEGIQTLYTLTRF